MHRFLLACFPLLRGAALALLIAGLTDALAVGLGGGADLRVFALGAILIALATGAVHEGAGTPPPSASFVWLGLGAVIPMFAGFAPLAGAAGLLLLLPLRAVGARVSGYLAVAERPGRQVGLHALGAALGLWWAVARGLGPLGFLLVLGAGWLLIVRAPTPALGAPGDGLPRERRLILRIGRFAFGAGLAWAWLLLAPLARAFDGGTAAQDGHAVLTCLVFGALGWLTVGALIAESARCWAWAALAAGVLGLLLPWLTQGIVDLSQALNFDARMRVGFLRELLNTDAPRLPEESIGYVPWVLLSTIGMAIVLGAIALRGALGAQPTGPDDAAPLLAGAGCALVASALPLGAPHGESQWLAHAGVAALLTSAAATLVGQRGAIGLRFATAVGLGVAAVLLLRPPPAPHLEFPQQDVRPWSVARDPQGRPLALAVRGAQARIVEQPADRPEQYLAHGRTLLTPELDHGPKWVREAELALACAPAAPRVLVAGAPHPASLRALAAGGAREAVLAGDPAWGALLTRRDPAGYGLPLGQAPALARAEGEFQLVWMRSQGLWASEHALLTAAAAAQARHRLAPEGVAVLGLDPEQLTPGILAQVLAAWSRAFATTHLLAAPDGLRGVSLLIVGHDQPDATLPPDLIPLALSSAEVQAAAGGVGGLLGPLPRVRAPLAQTAWRLVDELRATRRSQAVLESLLERSGATGPSLLRAAAAQYAAQEYSSHDTYLRVGVDAVEVSRAALEELAGWARRWPESAWVRATWADVADTLAAKREVEYVEEFVRPLREQLGWRGSGINLPLAQAALEMLDEEEARLLLEEVLVREPEHPGALHWLRVLRGEEPLAPDAHAGHDHD